MKKLVVLFFLIFTVKFSIAGGAAGINIQEYWLLIVPASILVLMLLFSFIKRKTKQMIITYRERKEQEALEEECVTPVDEFAFELM